MTGRARRLRIVLYASGIPICLLLSDGWTCHAIGGLVTVVALALYWLESPRFFRLVLMWCAGFLLIVTPEGLTEADKIQRIYGASAFDIASRCLVTSHFAMLLGHDLLFREGAVRPLAVTWRISPRTALPFLFIGWAIIIAYYVPTALLAYRAGRAGQDLYTQTTFRALAQGVATSASVTVPIAAAWFARRTRGAPRAMLLAIVASVVLIQVILAVRFMLLFVVVGCVITWTVPRKPNRKIVAILLIGGLVLALGSTVLLQTRTFGLQNADVGAVVEDVSSKDIIMSEETVQSMTQAVVYARIRGFTDGRTSSALVVFWVPRALWPTKPTLIGYWLPREFGPVDAGFSSAPGFTGGTYVDFGLGGSLVFWLLAGLLFGLLERLVARICDALEDARVLLVAPLYGGVFFAVRSVETATLVLVGVLLLAAGMLVLGGKRLANVPPRVG